MKILNANNELFFLKAINLVGQGRNISMFFRQGEKYQISRLPDSIYYYKNVSLILCFDTAVEASEHFKILKDLYLNQSISIDVNGDLIEFVGGNDYSVRVMSYHEDLIDQFVEDWIDRYVFLSQWVLEKSDKEALQADLLSSIELKVKDFLLKNPESDSIKDFSQSILSMIDFSRGNTLVNAENNLLAHLNQKMNEINSKLDSIIGTEPRD